MDGNSWCGVPWRVSEKDVKQASLLDDGPPPFFLPPQAALGNKVLFAVPRRAVCILVYADGSWWCVMSVALTAHSVRPRPLPNQSYPCYARRASVTSGTITGIPCDVPGSKYNYNVKVINLH
jgi:hypothetical protein